MILLPHLFVLQYLKKQCEHLRNHPQELEFLLCGYDSCVLSDIYGADYICKAIQAFKNREIFFMLGSRLDIDKLPSICVTYEGGSEREKFIGQFGGTENVKIPKRQYAAFSIKGLIEGDLLVSPAEDIKSKIWRGLIVRQGKFSSKIVDILPEGNDVRLILSKKATLDLVELRHWTAESPVVTKIRSIGSSMDAVTVKIYLTIDGDPEIADMISTIIRYLLKQAHLFLETNGLYETTMTHSALSKSSDFDESQVWAVEFSISGLLHDQWIMSESTNADKLELVVVAKPPTADLEEVKIWPQD